MYLVVIIILNFRKTVTCHFCIWNFWNCNQNWNIWNWNWNWNLLWVVELEFKIMELELNWWNGIDPKTVGYILIMNQQTCRWKKWPHRCIFTWNWFCGKATSVSLIAIKPSHLYRTSVSGICKLYAFPYILSRDVREIHTIWIFRCHHEDLRQTGTWRSRMHSGLCHKCSCYCLRFWLHNTSVIYIP